jgi:hypothetical protein
LPSWVSGLLSNDSVEGKALDGDQALSQARHTQDPEGQRALDGTLGGGQDPARTQVIAVQRFRICGEDSRSEDEHEDEQSTVIAASARGSVIAVAEKEGQNDFPAVPPEMGKGSNRGTRPRPLKSGGKAAGKQTSLPDQPPHYQFPAVNDVVETAALGQTPFGKRLHWIKPVYDPLQHETVFSVPLREDTEFDAEMLTSHLREGSKSPAKPKRRAAFPREETRICILTSARAQHLAIALSRLRVSPAELCVRLKELDFVKPDVRAEDIEQLLGKCPTAHEVTAMLKHADHPEQLRDIERKIMPLCSLPNADSRLRLAHVSLTHTAQYTRVMSRLECVQAASKDVLASTRLHQLLRMVLKIANYINHGCAEGAKSFSVKSLPAFTSFKVGSASALQYLCRALCDVEFVQGLKDELVHVFEAARDNTTSLKQDIVAVGHAATFVESQLANISVAVASGDDVQSTVEQRGVVLLTALQQEHSMLELTFDLAVISVEDAQRYLGEPSSPMLLAEEFFSCLASFVMLLGPVAVDMQRARTRRYTV